MTFFVKTFLKKPCDFVWDKDLKGWIKSAPTQADYNAARLEIAELATTWGLTFTADE